MANTSNGHPSPLLHSPCSSLNTSILQDNVYGVQELVSRGIHQVPNEYIRPPDQRVCVSQLSSAQEVPLIDLAELLGERRSRIVAEIGRACKDWGIFQVVNHGVSHDAIEKMWISARKFFEQPVEERMRYHSEDFRSPVAYHTSFVPSKEQVKEWRDVLGFRCIPGQPDDLKQAPPFCREPALEYFSEVRALVKKVYQAIFENLKLQADSVEKVFPGIQQLLIALNYYPPCPDPSLTLGLGGHTDAGFLTVLLQDEVSGLQVSKGGRWVQVNPIPGSLVINLADQIQILTNGKYKGAIHRAVTNSERPRMSIGCFFVPCEEARIGPLPELIDSSNPPLYKETRFGDYLKSVYSKGLSTSNLDSVKLSSTSPQASIGLFPSQVRSSP